MRSLRSIISLTCAFLFASGFGLKAETIFAVTEDNRLISFSSNMPNNLLSNVGIVNLAANEQILGIDFRPRTNELYALGSTSRLYTINPFSGAASQVGGLLNVPLSGSFFGVDFNPVVDLLRVVSNDGQNLRINPVTGTVLTNISPNGDTPLNYRTTPTPDVNAGIVPNVVAAAYSNNVDGATTTTLYVLDSSLDVLATQNPPNGGVLNTLGMLNVNLLNTTGFDISGNSGMAYLTAGNTLWSVNLTQAEATLIGSIAVGTPLNIRDISVSPLAPVPEPGTFALISGALFTFGLYRRYRRS